MREIKFRVWHHKEKKMYFRGYQKWFHVLLCREDSQKPEGPGIPVARASFGDCHMMESADVLDKDGREIFEGDILEIHYKDRVMTGAFESVPDMYRSRRLHPLHEILQKFQIEDKEFNDCSIRIAGNIYETPQLFAIL